MRKWHKRGRKLLELGLLRLIVVLARLMTLFPADREQREIRLVLCCVAHDAANAYGKG